MMKHAITSEEFDAVEAECQRRQSQDCLTVKSTRCRIQHQLVLRVALVDGVVLDAAIVALAIEQHGEDAVRDEIDRVAAQLIEIRDSHTGEVRA